MLSSFLQMRKLKLGVTIILSSCCYCVKEDPSIYSVVFSFLIVSESLILSQEAKHDLDIRLWERVTCC